MKVIGIVCSPRKGGNTEILISRALEAASKAGAEETEMIHLSGKHINPCDGCGSCHKTAKCHIDDDMQAIYPKLLEADGIIIGSPVYFWGVTSQAKALIDRTYCLSLVHRVPSSDTNQLSGPYVEGLRNKVGGTITVARRSGATSAGQQISDFFRLWRIIEAGAAIAYADEKGDVKNDERGLHEAQSVGKAVVRTIKLTQATTK